VISFLLNPHRRPRRRCRATMVVVLLHNVLPAKNKEMKERERDKRQKSRRIHVANYHYYYGKPLSRFFLNISKLLLLTHGTDTSSGVKYFFEKGSIVVVIILFYSILYYQHQIKSNQIKSKDDYK
jgi:hypothetical protein